MSEQESSPAEAEVVGGPQACQQILRLMRLAKDFDRTVRSLPDGQQYIDEQHEVVKSRRRSQTKLHLIGFID
jgi:hypothetical protein